MLAVDSNMLAVDTYMLANGHCDSLCRLIPGLNFKWWLFFSFLFPV